jgi:gamma-glutamyl-gamma-aminobutyrate hydrolase PuuD
VKLTTHDVQIGEGSALERVLGSSAIAPAMHHQAINRLGNGLTSVAWTKDEVIEAVEMAGHRFGIGVQWHPEEGDDLRIFEALVNAAKIASVPQPSPASVGQSAVDMSNRSKRPAKRPAARR